MFRCVFAVLAALVALAATQSQIENIDIDAVLADPAKVDAVVSCFLNDDYQGCNERSKFIKGLIAETVKTNCGSCSDGQKAGVVKFLVHISRNKPESMKQLLAKYDPNGEALVKYGDIWRQNGISV
uniref:Chemosensory protein 13 n=1 Tax=Oedaleus infernalis TaxID=267432 RepID=A0A3G2LGG0_9ORTH|nr:chemosensory protein 13 [Oedaleus infernalis]